MFTCLVESDRDKAEILVLRAIKKIVIDERAVRAAGYLKILKAVPVLKWRHYVLRFFTNKQVRESIHWALLKINHNRQHLNNLIKVVNGSEKTQNLTIIDAIELLSDFGEEPAIIKALLHAFLAEDLSISISAQSSLRKIFKNNQEISDLLIKHGFTPPQHIKYSIVNHIESHIIFPARASQV
jgi:hypothetical protein